MRKATFFWSATLLLSVTFIYLGNLGSGLWFSEKIVNNIFPCVENWAETSFPCNGSWDIGLTIFAVILGITSLWVLIFKIKIFRK